uniref:hypothetical protein n=1 Tax=Flavobacterium sp. TaxID=239 RepID=UPI00404B070A
MSPKIINLFQPKQNNSELYNMAINQIIAHFKKEKKNLDESLLNYLNLIIEGWNIANLRNHSIPNMPSDYFRHLGVTAHEHVLEKVIAYKNEHFKDLALYIYEYEIVNEKTPMINILQLLDHGDFSIVMLQDEMAKNIFTEEASDLEDIEEDDFFDDDFFDDDFFDDDNDHEEGYLNRHILVVKPKQPFYDWANEIRQNHQKMDKTMFRTYLISEDINPNDWLKKNYKRIIEIECFEMTDFLEEVPKKVSFKMFQEWFTVEFSESIYDFEADKIEKF